MTGGRRLGLAQLVPQHFHRLLQLALLLAPLCQRVLQREQSSLKGLGRQHSGPPTFLRLPLCSPGCCSGLHRRRSM